MKAIMRSRTLALVAKFWVVTLLMAATSHPAWAQILTRTTQRPTENWNPILPLTLGTGLDVETNNGESQYFIPLLAEYNFAPTVKFSFEAPVGYITGTDVKAGGLGDIDTSLEWEFLRERRWRPALTAVGDIRWPSAIPSDLGSPNWDYQLGLIASKDMIFADVDLGLVYTFSGDTGQQDTLEISLAGEIPLTHRWAIEFEAVASVGKDLLSGQSQDGGAGFNYEGTLGLGWQVTRFIKLEGGATLKNDGTQQYTVGWVYNFSGDW